MNRERRKKLSEAGNKIREAIEILEEVKEEEEAAYDNLPDSFRDGDRGERMLEYIDTMEDAIGQLEDADSSIEEIQE